MKLGITEILLVLVIALIIFGPSRLPALGAAVGKAIREFKGSIKGGEGGDKPAEPPSAPKP